MGDFRIDPKFLTPVVRVKKTLEEYRRSFHARQAAHRKLMEANQAVGEGYHPQSVMDYDKDIAFGVTPKHIYLDATMYRDEEGKPAQFLGKVSHMKIQQWAGLAQPGKAPKPGDDFIVRGMVKAKLDGRVIFWEGGDELFRKHDFVKQAIEELLKRGLIRDDAQIYGAGEDDPVARAFDVQQDW